MRIRTRLLILILAILVPAFMAALLAVGYVYLEERRAQENSVRETVRMFSLLVENEVQNDESVLRTLANSPALTQGDLRAFYQHARALMPNGRRVLSSSTPACRSARRCRASASPTSASRCAATDRTAPSSPTCSACRA
jgi:hypothetical protein